MSISRCLIGAFLLLCVTSARADFTGQPLLGPVTAGSIVGGNTSGHADDNDGFTSGDHIFDIWPGPDDVWQLNWPGGDMHLQLDYSPAAADLDLFLYEPGSLNDSGNYSIMNTGVETILAPGAAAGTYFINIDSDQTGAGAPYTLTVFPVPEPTSFALIGAIFVMSSRRAKRA